MWNNLPLATQRSIWMQDGQNHEQHRNPETQPTNVYVNVKAVSQKASDLLAAPLSGYTLVMYIGCRKYRLDLEHPLLLFACNANVTGFPTKWTWAMDEDALFSMCNDGIYIIITKMHVPLIPSTRQTHSYYPAP